MDVWSCGYSVVHSCNRTPLLDSSPEIYPPFCDGSKVNSWLLEMKITNKFDAYLLAQKTRIDKRMLLVPHVENLSESLLKF